jgi:tripartite-type tricarboxylate transporter receptor subunit TctC
MLGWLLFVFTIHGAAQTYPSRPIKIVVPFAAGGGPDIDARRLAPRLADALGVAVVVENRVGAAGILAAELVTQAPPDGYTVLSGSISQVVQKILRPQAKFDPLTSFLPVGQTSTSPTVLVVPVDSPVKTVKELEALLRNKPGQINYGSGGIGTSAHIMGASFVNLLKLNAVHIPYRGSVELMPALIGGQIQFAFPIAGTGVPMVKSGKARALAVTVRPSGYGFETRNDGNWVPLFEAPFSTTDWKRGTTVQMSGARQIRVAFDSTGLPSSAANIAIKHDNVTVTLKLAATGDIRVVR